MEVKTETPNKSPAVEMGIKEELKPNKTSNSAADTTTATSCNESQQKVAIKREPRTEESLITEDCNPCSTKNSSNAENVTKAATNSQAQPMVKVKQEPSDSAVQQKGLVEKTTNVPTAESRSTLSESKTKSAQNTVMSSETHSKIQLKQEPRAVVDKIKNSDASKNSSAAESTPNAASSALTEDASTSATPSETAATIRVKKEPGSAEETINAESMKSSSVAESKTMRCKAEAPSGNQEIINKSSQSKPANSDAGNETADKTDKSSLTADARMPKKKKHKHVPMVYIKPEPIEPTEETTEQQSSTEELSKAPSASIRPNAESTKLAGINEVRKVPARTLPKPIIEVKQEPGEERSAEQEKIKAVQKETAGRIPRDAESATNPTLEAETAEPMIVHVKKEPCASEEVAEPNSNKSKTEQAVSNTLAITAESNSENVVNPNLEVQPSNNEFTKSSEKPPATTANGGNDKPQNLQIMEKAVGNDNMTSTVFETERNCAIPEAIPDDFFDDLIHNAELLPKELSAAPAPPTQSITETDQDDAVRGEESKTMPSSNFAGGTQPRVKHEPSNQVESDEYMDDDAADLLPNNFFDDLLVDHVAERSARIANEAQEIKYSEQLRSLKERLRKMDEEKDAQAESGGEEYNKNQSHKHKHKKSKSKKKSNKREKRHEHEEPEPSSTVEPNTGDESHGDRKRKRNHSKMEPNESFQLNMNYGNLANMPALPTGQMNYGSLPKIPKLSISKQATAAGTAVEIHDYNHTSKQLREPMVVKVEEQWAVVEKMEADLECLPVQSFDQSSSTDDFSGFKRIKLEKPATGSVTSAEPLIVTPAMKRQKALQLAADTVRQFQLAQQEAVAASFHFVSSVRKLPSSHSVVAQRSYENRSPLHTVNNVRYAFNSNSTRINLNEWGLEALPKAAAKVVRTIGYDANSLLTRIQAANMKSKYTKVKLEPTENSETVDETKSSFFTNAMTQTEDVYEHLLSMRRRNAHSIGVQAIPMCGSKGTQTIASGTGTGSPNDDLPLMQLINVLNENQLLALNDFAELINEPASSAMDMYRLRARMLEIYKCSQLPSAMPMPSATPRPVPTPTAPPTSIYSHSYQQLNSVEYGNQHNQFGTRGQHSAAVNHSSSQFNLHQLHQQHQQRLQQQEHPPIPVMASRDPRSGLRGRPDPRLSAAPLGSQHHPAATLSDLHGLPSAAGPPKKSYGRGIARR